MASVSIMFPKNQRPQWTPNLEALDCHADGMVELPLVGWVTAGEPIDMFENNETVAAPRDMVKKNAYALRVRGHSMIDDNIQDGDIIIVEKRESAENGQSVIALINGEQVTLKKFYVEPNGIRLQPANPDMSPIYLQNSEVQVLGIVSGVIRTT